MRRLIWAGGLILGSLALNVAPSQAGQTVDPCYKRCGPLMVNVKPVSEAKRVFHNCYVLCQRKGYLWCPGGILKDIRFGTRCPTP